VTVIILIDTVAVNYISKLPTLKNNNNYITSRLFGQHWCQY